ncbi:MAG: protein translocase subunit SecF [Helicobacteraceae bacterium]|jgi:preprotein translocase subunit SecF|nr:protein translocase subunit SecF [Helicobacteraceae bacterium]
MSFFVYHKIYQFSKIQQYALAFFGVLFAASIALIFMKTPNYGIDFSGGTVIQVRYSADKAPIAAITDALNGTRFEGAAVQEFGAANEVVIKANVTGSTLGVDVGDEAREILAKTGDFEIRKVDMVGAKVGGELRRAGLMAVIFSLVGILIYIAFRFEFRFALAAVLCTIHDITLTMGFVILFEVPINLEILAAILTVLGYSLNDTIVVFDRIREIMSRKDAVNLNDVTNEALSHTLSRTILTSFTTLFVVLTTYLFGGEILKPLSLVLIAGIIIGTLSSIFVAASLLSPLKVSVADWKSREAKRAQIKAEKERMRALYERGAV